MPLRSAAVCCAVGLLTAATMTLLGCGEDTEVTPFLGGKVNATAATNYTTAAAEKSTAVTEHKNNTEYVPRELKTAAKEETVKTNQDPPTPKKACENLQKCGSCSSKDGLGQCVPSRKTGEHSSLFCATGQPRIDSVCACSVPEVDTCSSCSSDGVWGKCVVNADKEAVCSTGTDHAQQWADNDCTLFNVAGFKFKNDAEVMRPCSWITAKNMKSRQDNYCNREVTTQCALACDFFAVDTLPETDYCSGDGASSECNVCSNRDGWGKCVPFGNHADRAPKPIACATDAGQWASECPCVREREDSGFVFAQIRNNVNYPLDEKRCAWIDSTCGDRLDEKTCARIKRQRSRLHCTSKGEVATRCAFACGTCKP